MNSPTQTNSLSDSRIAPSAMIQSRVRVGRNADHRKETKLKLNKNGSTIESINITCACGEEIIIECVYSDDRN
jgi:hypothetical protein